MLIDENAGHYRTGNTCKNKGDQYQIPVVLITKNETENLMDDAIGSQITDYLIKPVNPNQVWLVSKKDN